jgi:PAS domain S-box-containing protein
MAMQPMELQHEYRGIRRRTILFALLLTLLMIGNLVFGLLQGRTLATQLAEAEAKANLRRDLAFRRWTSSRGGLYIEVDEKVKPNPFLANVPHRDITSTTGQKLTLHNPATVLREIMHEQRELYGIRASITGKQVLNPINAPDAWEKKALDIIEKNRVDYSEVTEIDGKPMLRMMQPMYMEAPCLKCHAWTGIPVGGLRGGTDVAIPLEPYFAIWRQDALTNTASHGALWLLAMGFIFGSARRDRRYADASHRHQNTLRASEAQFRSLFEDAPIGHVLNRISDGGFVKANPAFCALTGYSQDELMSMTYADLTLPEYRALDQQRLVELAAHGKFGPYDKAYRRKDGTHIDVRLTSVLADDTDGKDGGNGNNESNNAGMILSVIEDITARKATERELEGYRNKLEQTVRERTEILYQTVDDLQKAKDEAERASAAKTEFLSRMSHELRTPMNAVLGFSQLMETSGTLPADDLASAREITQAGQHLLTLINEVLDLARIDSGHIELSVETVLIDELLENSLSLIRTTAAARNIRLNTRGLAGLAIRGDYTRTRQVLINLLSNAVKYNRDDGEIEISLEQCTRDGHDFVRISVRDTGHGIAADNLPRLFRPFERLVSSYEGIEGTGIGLALTKKLVEAMHGYLGVESEPGKGSTFWVELPAGSAATDHNGHAQNTEIPAPTPPTRRRKTVLYIEDNPANLRMMKKVIDRRPQWQLTEATNGSDGLMQIRASMPDLILLDINLPDIDGFEIMVILRESFPDTLPPVIAISANAMMRDVERGKAAGFSEYMTKPVDVTKVLAMLDAYAADSDSAQPNQESR